jgi:hypothetical protein
VFTLKVVLASVRFVALSTLAGLALVSCALVIGLGELPGPGSADGGDGTTGDGGGSVVTIAQNQAGPVAIALDATRVYWINAMSGSIVFCPKTGCNGAPSEITRFTTDQNVTPNRYRLATDAANVFALVSVGSSAFSLLQSAIAGCANNPTVLVDANQTLGFGVGPSSVFVGVKNTSIIGDAGPPFAGSFAGVVECAIGGCSRAPSAFVSEARITGMAVRGGRVFMTVLDTAVQKDILSCPASGCAGAPQVLLSGPFPLTGGMTVDETHVYARNYISQTENGLLACSTAGCGSSPTVLLTGLGLEDTRAAPFQRLISDGKAVYFQRFASEGGRTRASLVSCDVKGCGAEPTLVLPPQVDDFAVDETGVYFIDSMAGKVQKIPR